MADLGFRKEIIEPGSISLLVGGTTVLATTAVVPSQFSGNWATYTASYTATAADAGAAIRIVLATTGGQGDFDNVRLSATGTVPEPAGWALLIAGFALTGAALRRRTVEGIC